MKKLQCWISLSLLILISNSLKSQEFHPYIGFPTSTEPLGSAIADVNNDGLNDVITGYYNNGEIRIQYQQDRSLSPFVVLPINESPLYSFDVGDVNQDGKIDIVVTAGKTYGIFYQNDEGEFHTIQKTPVPDAGRIIRVGDINNDSKNDIVLATYNSLDFLYQTDPGEFLHEKKTLTHYFGELKIKDINNDQLNDLLFTSGPTSQLYTFLQKTTGGFRDPIITYINSSANDLAVGDLNNDGLADVVTTKSGGGDSNFKVFYPSLNDYVFYSYVQYSAQSNAGSVEIADLNNDGKNEIIIGNGGFNSYSIHASSYGNFSKLKENYMPYPNASQIQSLSVGDINNDGAMDLVFTYWQGVNVIYNKGGYLSAADQSLNSKGKIFPNPVNGSLHFSENQAGVAYSIYDMSGKVILRGKVDANNKIETSLLSTGNYILNLHHKAAPRQTFKFIKK